MTTKREIVDRAYSAAGLASYAFDLSPDELEQARQSLDAMVAAWGIRGQRLGYNTTPDLGAELNVPDWAEEAIALNLALRLSGALGKQVMPDTSRAAREGYTAVLSATTQPMPMLARAVPSGAGWKPGYLGGQRVIPQQEPPLRTNGDSELEIGE